MEDIQIIIELFIGAFTSGIRGMADLFTLKQSTIGNALIFTFLMLSFIISINILLGLINIFRKG